MSDQPFPTTPLGRVSRARSQVDHWRWALRTAAMDHIEEIVRAAHPSADHVVLEPSDQADHYLGGDIKDASGAVLGPYDDLDPESDILAELGYGGGITAIFNLDGSKVLALPRRTSRA